MRLLAFLKKLLFGDPNGKCRECRECPVAPASRDFCAECAAEFQAFSF